jgi:hypothetical protein
LSRASEGEVFDLQTMDVVALDLRQALRRAQYRLTQSKKKDLYIDGITRIGIVE